MQSIIIINIDINDQAVQKGLSGILSRGGNLKPLMQEIGEDIARVVEGNFAAGGRPEAWKPSARSRRDSGKPLSDSGVLRRSITVDADNNSVRVGTDVEYARIHQLGGIIEKYARSELFVRNRYQRGDKKGKFKTGTTAGRGFTFGAHRIKMPARPFLGLSEADHLRIERIAADYIGGGP